MHFLLRFCQSIMSNEFQLNNWFKYLEGFFVILAFEWMEEQLGVYTS